jgi:nucleotide-binding universal stress UspA family protein
MSESATGPDALRKILLATDLSARGDRALERAVALATERDAQLLIVHVFEELDEATSSYRARGAPSWQRPPDAVAVAKLRVRQALRADLGDAIDRATLRIEEGDPAEVIERIAVSEGADLVITGIAREGPFASRPVILGKTVEQLLRRLPVPVLVVMNRARAEYRHVIVATDFSATSGHALQVALRLFPSQPIHLLHASEAPYSTLVADQDRHAEAFVEAHARDLADFLNSVFMPEEDRRRIVPSIEPGAPQRIVREYVNARGADLVVLGTRGRGPMLEALLGSSAKSILASMPCDALVVGGPRR